MTPTTPSAPDEVVLDEDGLRKAAIAIAEDTPLGQMHRASEIAGKAIRAYLRASPQPAGVTEEQVEDVASRMADEIAAAVMGNDHLVHLLDEQQADEVHGDIQIEAVRRIRTALQAASLPSPTDTRERIDVDELANEIRYVDGENKLGAGALAEALMPFLTLALKPTEAPVEDGLACAKEEAIDLLLGANDIWTDHGSGFRIHFSFEHGASDRVIERVMTAHALAASTKEE